MALVSGEGSLEAVPTSDQIIKTEAAVIGDRLLRDQRGGSDTASTLEPVDRHLGARKWSPGVISDDARNTRLQYLPVWKPVIGANFLGDRGVACSASGALIGRTTIVVAEETHQAEANGNDDQSQYSCFQCRIHRSSPLS